MRNNAYSSKNTACFALKKGVARVRAATPEIGVFFTRVTPGVTPVLTPGDPPGISNWRFQAPSFCTGVKSSDFHQIP